MLKNYILDEDNFIIQGGYFETEKGIDAFSTKSYRDSLVLLKSLKSWGKKNVRNVILVNNIQKECKKANDTISNEGDISIEHTIDLLNTEQIEISYLKESHMKNVGMRKIKKLLKKEECIAKHDLFRTNDNGTFSWFVNTRDPILLLIGKNGSLIAKCPLIMGAFYYYLQKNYQPGLKTVIIDLCKIDEQHKIRDGVKVANDIFLSNNISKIITIYYNDLNNIVAFDIFSPIFEKTFYLNTI